MSASRTLVSIMIAIAIHPVAHGQGTIDMSGATALMTTVKTFAEHAGAVICLISLIFAGVQTMSGYFAMAIPALGGAIFGARRARLSVQMVALLPERSRILPEDRGHRISKRRAEGEGNWTIK